MLQGAWKLKHKQKLEEVEAEEEAAESQDISEDAQEPVPESLQPVSRPMRAIRAPRYAAMDRADVLPTRSSRDTETGSPPTPLRRAGRGGPLPFPPRLAPVLLVQFLAHMQRVADTSTPLCGHYQRRLSVAALVCCWPTAACTWRLCLAFYGHTVVRDARWDAWDTQGAAGGRTTSSAATVGACGRCRPPVRRTPPTQPRPAAGAGGVVAAGAAARNPNPSRPRTSASPPLVALSMLWTTRRPGCRLPASPVSSRYFLSTLTS